MFGTATALRAIEYRMLAVIAVILCGALPAAKAEPLRYDVVVYGGSSAGVIAAVQAAQMGKSTLLVVPGRHFGGTTASGLGETDTGDPATIGGLALAFYGYIGRYYQTPSADDSLADATAAPLPSTAISTKLTPQFRFEPHVAEAVFTEMLRGAGATWIFNESLDRVNGVVRIGNRIVSIQTKSGRTISGRMFIDATYEGDLMAAAGVRYRIGRESASEFGESIAGVQRNEDRKGEVDPYRVPGQPASGLLPGVRPAAPGPNGSGDSRVQQFNFRVCLTNVSSNRVSIGAPADYNRENYELLARRLQQHPDWPFTEFCKVQPMPAGKTDINTRGSFSTDMAGDDSTNWSEATDEERVAIQHTYRSYTQGFFWFLANDPAVPAAVRAEASRWGLAQDEFADNDHWPWQLYVREARRMVGNYVITQQDCDGLTVASDSIALGSYAMDSHTVTLFVDESGQLNAEGFIFRPSRAYPISYRAITPRNEECANLLVPICLSATHVAFNSIRMEPVYMMLGQSAATAACLAIDQGTSVQGINYGKLARHLKADGQILTPADTELHGELLPLATLEPLPSPESLVQARGYRR
jgi:hypothetical protein